MRVVRVAIDVPLSTLFDYFLNVDLPIEIGQRVLVPFGRKNVVGIVVASSENGETTILAAHPVAATIVFTASFAVQSPKMERELLCRTRYSWIRATTPLVVSSRKLS